MEFFNFRPEDFQVLEDIEFDETIQRPEKVRFYTLDEQSVDAFEKMIPRGRVRKFQLVRIRKEVDRYVELYKSHVVVTPEDYQLRPPSFGTHVPWLYPVYASDELKSYSFAELALDPTIKGGYPRMIAALPRPYAATTQGQPLPIDHAQEFLDMDGQHPLRALPIFERTKANVHEDQRITIEHVPIEGTADNVSFVGYYLAKRPLDIPNPLPDHPFFKANEPNTIETTSPLADVFPSLDAVLTHGVPTTKDPYGEALPYLKLYDVSLQDIPWSLWKTKFPQVDVVADRAPPQELNFPTPRTLAPPESLVSEYKSPYFPGVSVRTWLQQQLDGGELVIQMLLSKAIDHGSVEITSGLNIGAFPYPETTPDECTLLGTNFQEFVTRGLLRRISDKKYQCVPLEFIRQERARVGYVDRTPWKEQTPTELLQRHLLALASVRPIGLLTAKAFAETKTPMRPDSVLRKDVVLILQDPNRFTEDKIRDITQLLLPTTVTNDVHYDSDTNFVLCNHTLELLSGKMIDDRRAFYDRWTVKLEGQRVCRFCGQEIVRDDLEEQDQFDESGFAVKHAEALEQGPEFQTTVTHGFLTGLNALKPLFDLNKPLDDMMFLLISILQVLPDAQAVQQLLQIGRTLEKAVGTAQDDKTNKYRAAFGFGLTMVLLLIHTPKLVPRRSFGPRALNLHEDEIMKSLLSVIRKTFEAYPTAFKGASTPFVRGFLNAPKETTTLLQTIYTKKILTEPSIQQRMKERVVEPKQVIVEDGLVPLVMPPPEQDMNKITRFPPCPSNRPIWTNGKVPVLQQAEVPLRRGILASERRTDIQPIMSVREMPQDIPNATIQANLKKKKKAYPRALSEDYHANLLLVSRLADAFELDNPVRTVDTALEVNRLRDIALGLVYDILDRILTDPVKARKFSDMLTKDITLYVLFAKYDEEKAMTNKVRAAERMKFVERMGIKSDMEREITTDLMRIGLSEYVITNVDRAEIAREAELLKTTFVREEETGVGVPREAEDNGEDGGDFGDYGDRAALPNVDGRDPPEATFDDGNEGI